MTTFDLKLLQAINDWQKGGSHAKGSRGVTLKKLAAALDARFRSANQQCYRRIDLDDPNLQLLGETLRLPETISAWTLDPEVAQGFNQGVPPVDGKIGIIIRLAPHPVPGSVILNFDALFNDPGFRVAETDHRDQIKQYERGMGRYSNNQREVIIECPEVQLGRVWAWGGYSSSKEELLAGMRDGKYGAPYATPQAVAIVRRGLEAQPERLGPQWLSGAEAVQRTRDWLVHHAGARAARRSRRS